MSEYEDRLDMTDADFASSSCLVFLFDEMLVTLLALLLLLLLLLLVGVADGFKLAQAACELLVVLVVPPLLWVTLDSLIGITQELLYSRSSVTDEKLRGGSVE